MNEKTIKFYSFRPLHISVPLSAIDKKGSILFIPFILQVTIYIAESFASMKGRECHNVTASPFCILRSIHLYYTREFLRDATAVWLFPFNSVK